MPGPSAKAVLNDFRRQLAQSVQLVSDLKNQGTPFFRLQQVSELAFLRVYLAWESFLEESFTRFMCGATSASGSRPHSYAKPKDIEHARRLLIGPKLRYADWTEPTTVIERAKLIFKDGKPFVTPVMAIMVELNDMKTTRNYIAHRSVQARKTFATLIQNRFGVAHRHSAGSFLLSPSPAAGQTYLEFFSERVHITAQNILS